MVGGFVLALLLIRLLDPYTFHHHPQHVIVLSAKFALLALGAQYLAASARTGAMGDVSRSDKPRAR